MSEIVIAQTLNKCGLPLEMGCKIYKHLEATYKSEHKKKMYGSLHMISYEYNEQMEDIENGDLDIESLYEFNMRSDHIFVLDTITIKNPNLPIGWIQNNNLLETMINILPITLIEMNDEPDKLNNREQYFEIKYYNARFNSLTNFFYRDEQKKDIKFRLDNIHYEVRINRKKCMNDLNGYIELFNYQKDYGMDNFPSFYFYIRK